MAYRDIIVIASSAGGIGALTRLCASLPADLEASVFIAQHLSPAAKSVLPALLGRAGPLPVSSPVDGEAFVPGHVYVAPPDRHLLVREGRMLVRRGPHENRTRPAANALFRSAAIAYGARVIGVVLTGLLDDGTEGLIAIKAAGGTSIVQDPADAEWPSMPRNAVARDHVDHVASLAGIASLLARLSRTDAGPAIPLPQEYAVEDEIAAQEFAVTEREIETPGEPSSLSCPDCGGVLNQISTDDYARFRCQVGHAFTPLGLAEAQSEELERALGIAVRTHRDRVRLFTQMGADAEARGLSHAVRRWRSAREEAEQLIGVLEDATTALRKPPVDADE